MSTTQRVGAERGKGNIAPLRNRTCKYGCGQVEAVREGESAYRGDAGGDGDGCQAVAITESVVAYRSNAFGNIDGCQAVAIIESVVAYRSNAGGNGDGCQVITVFEGAPSTNRCEGCNSIADAVVGHRVWYNDISCYIIVYNSGAHHLGVAIHNVVVECMPRRRYGREVGGPCRCGT